MAKPTFGENTKERTRILLAVLLDLSKGVVSANSANLNIEVSTDGSTVEVKPCSPGGGKDQKDQTVSLRSDQRRLIVSHITLKFLEVQMQAVVKRDSLWDQDVLQRKARKELLSTKADLVRDVLTDYLQADFMKILQDNRKNKCSGIWQFTLEFWYPLDETNAKEKNLKAFEQEWERCRQEKVGGTPVNRKDPDSLDWDDVCRRMLSQRATSNPLMRDEADKRDRSHIYVPLALVERTKPDKRAKEDGSPEAGSALYQPQYEEKQRFEHEAFLTKVLADGTGKTQRQRIAMIGEAGAGKTTLLQTIADWILDEKDKKLGLPIWISLTDLGPSPDFEAYVLETWLTKAFPPHQRERAKAELIQRINQKQVWLLLDGLDEVAATGTAMLQKVNQALQGWLAAKSRVVLTCRLNVWQADVNFLEEFETYRLLDFSYPDQVNQFIDNWFQGSDSQPTEPDKGNRLQQELGKHERLRLQDLIKNPLRLTLLCQIWRSQEGRLPDTKADLYAWYVAKVYSWKAHCFTKGRKQQEALTQALGNLACQDIDAASGARFRLRESVVKKALKPKLFDLALQLNWLNRVGIAAESQTEEPVYAFFHATFQEYFAATAIDNRHFFLHNNQSPQPLSGNYRIFEPQWKEVLLLWLGRDDIAPADKESLIHALMKFTDSCGDENFYGIRAYWLAAAGIAEFQECTKADEIVAQLITWSFDDSNPELLRQAARQTLLETARNRVIVALERLLADSQNEDARRQAAYSLGQIDPGNPVVIAALKRLLAESQNEDTYRQTVYSLGNFGTGHPAAIAVLTRLLANSQDESTRKWVAKSLVRIGKGHPAAIAVLERLLANSYDEYTRGQAAERLGKIDPGNSAAIAALEHLLADDSQNEYTRVWAAESLGEINPGNPVAIDTLVHLLAKSQNEYISGQAAESFGRIGTNNPRAINALEHLLADDKQDEYTHWQAAKSLGKIDLGNPVAISVLKRLLANSHDEYTRGSVAYSLGKIDLGNSAAIDTLEYLLAPSQDEYIREWAAQSLGKIDTGNPAAINALAHLLATSHDESILWQAAQSLGKIDTGNLAAIDALVCLLATSQDESILWHTAQSLRKMLQTDQMGGVVSALKGYLSTDSATYNFDRFKAIYEVLWHCAQTLTYPIFYRAWHAEN